jgi:hypothetical protein
MEGLATVGTAAEAKWQQSTENYTHLTIKAILKFLLLFVIKQLRLYCLPASYLKTES